MNRLFLERFQRWHLGARRGQDGSSLGDVELTNKTRLKALFCQAQRLFLRAKVLSRDLDSAMRAAQLDIIASDFGHDRSQHITAIFLDGLEVGIECFEPT